MLETIEKVQPVVSLVISSSTLIGILFALYKFSSDPDVKINQKMALMEQKCKILHGSIDDDIALIKNNHLAHIEKDIAEIKTQLAVIVSKIQ